jgi:hypothetical protein
LHGDFNNAINGHWSPLMSWFLIPFVYLELEPILASRILSLIIGMFTLAGVNKILHEIRITDRVRLLYVFSLSPLAAWYAENDVAADVLCLCLVIYYIFSVIRDGYKNDRYAGILAGAAGALAYLAKAYNFIFLLHFTCVNVCYLISASIIAEEYFLNLFQRFFCLS